VEPADPFDFERFELLAEDADFAGLASGFEASLLVASDFFSEPLESVAAVPSVLAAFVSDFLAYPSEYQPPPFSWKLLAEISR
jgi:hypothetical protein